MKIYRGDGSYIENADDKNFGWFLADMSCEIECLKVDISVKLDQVKSTEETMVFENTQENPPKISVEEKLKFVNVDSVLPAKERLAGLIEPSGIETKCLLSIIHYSKYKMLDKEHLIATDKNKKEYRQELKVKKQNGPTRYETNSNCLMAELLLCDSPNKCRNGFGKCFNESLRTNGLATTFNLARDVKKISLESAQLRLEIEKLKLDFKNDEDRILRVKQAAIDLRKDLLETTYLEKILDLLNGKLEKVEFEEWPFKLCRSGTSKKEINLIV